MEAVSSEQQTNEIGQKPRLHPESAGHRATRRWILAWPGTLIATSARYAVVGGIGVVVNMGALRLLYGVVHLPLLVASLMAVELAIVQEYLFHDRWTFGRHYRPALSRFVKYNLASGVALALNVAMLVLLTALGINYLVADLAGIVAGAGVSFGASWSWIWTEDAP